MNITPITDQTLLFLTSLILATTAIAILAFVFVLYKVPGVVKNFEVSRIWPYICLSICAMIFFLLVLRGHVSSGVVAGFIGTALGLAFGTKAKQTSKTDSDPIDSPDRKNS